jgi:hypothetical protein
VLPQAVQLTPAGAHADAESDVHVVPEQHPLGQDVESQIQPPFTHRWPCVHAGPPPHVHWPDGEHPSPVDPHDAH